MIWDVRPCESIEEYQAALGAIGHYFGGWPPDRERAQEFSRLLPLERAHAVRDGDRIVAGAGAFPFRFTVPGGVVGCAGVTVVGVLPTHRRRGILTAMMRAQLDDVRDRGEPVAARWASEEVIYRRLGYGMASRAGEMKRPRTHTALRRRTGPDASVRMVSLDDAKSLLPPLYDRIRAAVPGMMSRSAEWWETRNLADPPDRRGGGGEKNVLVVDVGGDPAGYALYRIFSRFEEGSAGGYVAVSDARAEGPLATRELWRVLLELDWTASLEASLLPIDHPLVHQLAYPRRMRFRVGDGVWVRLVDVGAALSARGYAGDGAVVFEVEDTFLPENAGRWKVEGGGA